MSYYDDSYTGPGDPDYTTEPSVPRQSTPQNNWWEQPFPTGMGAPPAIWPPPLGPHQHYGPNFGQILWDAGYEGTEVTKETSPSTQGPAIPPPAGDTTKKTTTGGQPVENLLAPYGKDFPPPAVRFPGATGTGVPETPVFTPPGYEKPPAFDYGDFAAPTAEEVLNDPGYQFSRNEGERALKAGYASGGVLNTGGTMKDILAWGGNYANTRYVDVLNRKLNIYGTNRAGAVQKYNMNYGTQYQDPYSIAYQGAKDAFAPKMTGYATNAAANQRSNELDYDRAYENFQDEYARWKHQSDRTLDWRYKWATV